MLLRTFHGISIAAFTTAYSALVADISPPEKRGELIGYMSLVTPMGLAIGPAIGGFVQQGLGYTPLFLMTAGLGLLSGLCSTFLNNTPSPHQSQATNLPTSERFWVMLASPRIQIPATLMFIVGLIFGTITTFVPLHIQDSGVNFNPGFFYTMAAISSFTMRLLTGRASDRWGPRPLHQWGPNLLFSGHAPIVASRPSRNVCPRWTH